MSSNRSLLEVGQLNLSVILGEQRHGGQDVEPLGAVGFGPVAVNDHASLSSFGRLLSSSKDQRELAKLRVDWPISALYTWSMLDDKG